MHLQDTAHAFLLIFGSIQNIGSCIHASGIYAEEGKLSYEGICHNLKCQSGEGLVVGRMSLHLVTIQICSLDSRDISRRRHILKNSVQKLLDSPITVSGTAAYGNCRTLTGRFAENFLHILHGRLLAIQVHHHQFVIQLADLFHQLRTIEFSIVLHIAQVIGNGDVITLIVIKDISLHLKQVNDSLKVLFLADRQLKDNGIFAQSGSDLFYRSVEICSQDIHLIDERHTGNIVGVSLTPYVLGLRLHTALRAEDADSAVQHTKGTLYFYGKIHMARSINDIDTVLQRAFTGLGFFFQSPVAGCSCRCDGNTSLLLLLHPVHGSSAFMSITDLVVYASIIQNTLGQCGLTCIDMSHNSNISGSL